jgi:hypothetical protein
MGIGRNLLPITQPEPNPRPPLTMYILDAENATLIHLRKYVTVFMASKILALFLSPLA